MRVCVFVRRRSLVFTGSVVSIKFNKYASTFIMVFNKHVFLKMFIPQYVHTLPFVSQSVTSRPSQFAPCCRRRVRLPPSSLAPR